MSPEHQPVLMSRVFLEHLINNLLHDGRVGSLGVGGGDEGRVDDSVVDAGIVGLCLCIGTVDIDDESVSVADVLRTLFHLFQLAVDKLVEVVLTSHVDEHGAVEDAVFA